MKRLPRETVERMCKGKRRYQSPGDALDAVAVLGLERHREPYRCAHCGFWHLTSKTPRR